MKISTEAAIEKATRDLREHQQKIGKTDLGYEATRKIVQQSVQSERAKEEPKK